MHHTQIYVLDCTYHIAMYFVVTETQLFVCVSGPIITSFIYACTYTGCSAKMYPIFVLFISPVKIVIFQVCLFHIKGNFVFYPIFFPEYLLNYECTVRSWMNRGKLCLPRNYWNDIIYLFFFISVFPNKETQFQQ